MAENGYYYSINDFPGNGTQTTFEVSFAGGYISRTHISARLFKDSDGTWVDVPFTWMDNFTIRVSPAVPVGYTLRLYRTTPIDKPLVDYSDGALLNEVNLDQANRQAIFAAAESRDAFGTVPSNDTLRDAIAALAFARTRANHTGTQAISTVDGLAAALAASVSSVALAAATGANKVGFTEGGDAITETIEAVLRQQPVRATCFGAKFDGDNDDTIPLQKAIDKADAEGRPMIWPKGTAKITAPLKVFGKMVVWKGQVGKTYIKAGANMRCLIDDVAATDSYYNPMFIEGFVLDGSNRISEANLSMRYRHHAVVRSVWSQFPGPTTEAFRARDCWLGRYFDLRTVGCGTGFYAMGATHSSTWDSCDFNDCYQYHVWINGISEANDGNVGLTFLGCSTEFSHADGSAIGIRIDSGCDAIFFGGYLGENMTSWPVENRGGMLTIDGAVCYSGYVKTNAFVHPLAGKTLVKNCRMADQYAGDRDGNGNIIPGTSGIGLVQVLAQVTDAEAATATGKVRFENIDVYTPLGSGTRVFNSDMIDYGMAGQNFAASVGRVYQAAGFGGQTFDTASDGLDKVLTMTNSTSSIVALYAPFKRDDWIINKPVYIVVTYKATQPCVLALTAGIGGAPGPTIDTLPSTGGVWKTFINVLSNLEASPSGVQIYMPNPAQGAVMGLRRVTMSDARVSQGSRGGGPSSVGHI